MSMDLDQDYTINGHTFNAGKGVDTNVDEVDDKGKAVKVDYSDSLKEMQERSAKATEFASEHHGAVPTSADPNEATAQTPTRPLGGPNLAGVSQTATTSDVVDVHEVKDSTGEGADESNKKAQK